MACAGFLDGGAPFVVDLLELRDALRAPLRVRFEPTDMLRGGTQLGGQLVGAYHARCGLGLQRANRLLLVGGAALELEDACIARNQTSEFLIASTGAGLQRSVGGLQLGAQIRRFRFELLQAAPLRGHHRFQL